MAPAADWQLLPYAAGGDSKSFSQVLFEFLGMTSVVSEGAGRITMHQMLRLLYIDQETPISEILVHEPFDKPQNRTALGEFFLGVYDADVHIGRERARVLTALTSDLSAQVRLLQSQLAAGDGPSSVAKIDAELSRLNEERTRLYKSIVAKKRNVAQSEELGSQSGRAELARDALAEQR